MLRPVRSSLPAKHGLVAASLNGRQGRARGGVEVGSAARWDRSLRGNAGHARERLKPLHASLSLRRRLAGVVRPVVRIAMLPMLDTRQALAYPGTVASQLISDDHSRDVREAGKPLAEDLFRSCLSQAAVRGSRGCPRADRRHARDCGVCLRSSPTLCPTGMCPPIEELGIAIDWHMVARTSHTADASLHRSPSCHGQRAVLRHTIGEAEANIQPRAVADDLCGASEWWCSCADYGTSARSCADCAIRSTTALLRLRSDDEHQ
jgi:hypothetical protein